MNSYRSVLEVLRYLSYQDVLLSANLVSVTWKAASESQELWISLTEAIGIEIQTPSRAKFQEFVCAGLLLNIKGRYCIYRCCSRTVKQTIIRKQLFVSYASSVLFLPGNNLLLCGGQAKHTYIYHVISGAIKELGMMGKRRQYHGLISDEENVYAFGGVWTEPFQSCEKLNLSSEVWSPLPDMLVPRSRVKPCRYGSTIYLCGGCSREELQCEQFDTNTSLFSPMEMQLPALSSVRFAYVYEGELVLVGNDAVHVYRTGTLELVARKPHEIDNWFFSLVMNPVVIGRQVYYSRNWDTIYRLDMDLGKLAQIYPVPQEK